jgi:hypothetical protein
VALGEKIDGGKEISGRRGLLSLGRYYSGIHVAKCGKMWQNQSKSSGILCYEKWQAEISTSREPAASVSTEDGFC